MMDFSPATSAGISYRERAGDGPVLLCLHGIGSNAQSFDILVPHLPANARVIAWNAPGYGDSLPLETPWPQAADYAQALHGMVERLELERFFLVGHSLGTLMGVAYANLYPERVEQLVLASCALGHGVAPGSGLSEAAQKRLDDLERLGASSFAAERAVNLIYRPDENPTLVARVRNGMAQVKNPGYGQAVRMLASGQLAQDCARLGLRATVIVGAQDRVTPPEKNAIAHRAIPEACRGAFEMIDGAGHALYQQAPEQFGALVSALVGVES